MKARITVRPSLRSDNLYTLLNGKSWIVVDADKINARGIMGQVDYLKSINCESSAKHLLNCVRFGG